MQGIDVLYDHYKETFKLSKDAQAQRNRCFVILCFLEAISFLMIIQSDVAISVLSGMVSKYSESHIVLGSTILQTLLWVLVAYTLIRYVQQNTYIERQYAYIEELESSISKSLDGAKFDRESKNYLNEYPIVLDVIDIFYKWFAPILFITINISRIVIEWKERGMSLATICDSAICSLIIIVSLFYILAIHPKVYEATKKLFRRKKNG